MSEIDKIARKTGFVKIDSKFSGSDFLRLLLLNSEKESNVSLNQLAIEFSSLKPKGISKQGIDKRFNDKAVLFMKTLLENYLKEKNLTTIIPIGWCELFNRILIKDGTRFNLPAVLADKLIGFGGGSASKAGACIQYEFDLKNGDVIDLTLTSANVPDAKNAQTTRDSIQKGDLILRDLGYFGLNIIKEIKEKGAFIISKLNVKTIIFIRKADNYVPLDLKELYGKMCKVGQKSLEMDVWIGKGDKTPIRLIIELMPEQVYEKRIRDSAKYNQKKGYKTSEDFRIRSRFNLTITNIAAKTMPKEAVTAFYKLRWQVELMFKVWKSTFHIHKTRSMKYHRWVCLLYAKLLLIMVHWDIIRRVRGHTYQKDGKLLSVMKCFQTLKISANKITAMVCQKASEIKTTVIELSRKISEKHWLERKNNKLNEENIYYLLYCKSGYYVYI